MSRDKGAVLQDLKLGRRVLPTASTASPATPRTVLSGDGHALRSGRSLFDSPAPQGRSPDREVPATAAAATAAPAAAAAAAGPSGLAPHTAAASHRSGKTATSAGPRDPEPLPSGTASPRPRPGHAHCPLPRAERALPLTSALNAFPVTGAPPEWLRPELLRPLPAVPTSTSLSRAHAPSAALPPGRNTMGTRGEARGSWRLKVRGRSSPLSHRQELGPVDFNPPEPAMAVASFLPTQSPTIPHGFNLSFYPKNKTSLLDLPNRLMMPLSLHRAVKNIDSFLPALLISLLPHSIQHPKGSMSSLLKLSHLTL